MTDHPLGPTVFRKFVGTPYQGYILPIIPVGASLSPNSKLTPDHLGKIPGRYNAQEGHWAGWDWQNNRTTKTQLERWELQQIETGPTAAAMNTVKFPGLDIDSDDEAFRDMVWALADQHLDKTPVVRCRDGSVRAVLFYEHKDHTPPIRKFRIKVQDTAGQQHLVEFLAAGQQVVIEGPHAKGRMHYWRDGGLTEHIGALPQVELDQIVAFFAALRQSCEALGYETVKAPAGSAGGEREDAVSITNLMSPHLAADQDLLARAVRAIDLDDPGIDYDTFITLLRAICAASAGSVDFLHDAVWPWVCERQTVARGNGPRTEERGIEWLEERWRSFHDSQLGAEYVYGWAATFGFNDGRQALAQEIMAHAPTTTAATDGGGDQAADGNGGGGQLAAGAGVPSGPTPPNDTHRALALAFESSCADVRKYSVDTKRWLEHESAVWQPCHTVLSDIGDMAAALASQLLNNPTAVQGGARARALESTGTLLSVRTMLQARPAMIVREEDFDADQHLLNTPDFIVDLRTGETLQHAPHFLMRQQTLVTPDVLAYQNYDNACPRFIQLLRIIANGRDWVIPFLQRWFGYCLTGKIGHQHFLFIQGPPGTGKTQLITILLLLMHTYATTLRSVWMMKNSEKRFDMVKVVGKRMGFGDETQKGATFDEERLSNVAGSIRLQAEVKGGDEFDFPNRIKLNLTGNHRPNFISGEAGGLTRRMLLLEANNPPIKEVMQPEENFAELVVATEGPAILMWAIEGAMLDYADTDNTIFNMLKQPMVDAAYAYTRENSLYWQWVESRMRVAADADIDLSEAYEMFKDYAWSTTRERCRDRRSDFKAALKAMLKDQIEFALRTTRPHPGRTFIKGLGVLNAFDPSGNAGNVVDINSARRI